MPKDCKGGFQLWVTSQVLEFHNLGRACIPFECSRHIYEALKRPRVDLLQDKDCEREISSFGLHHGFYSCVLSLVQPLFVCGRQIL